MQQFDDVSMIHLDLDGGRGVVRYEVIYRMSHNDIIRIMLSEERPVLQCGKTAAAAAGASSTHADFCAFSIQLTLGISPLLD